MFSGHSIILNVFYMSLMLRNKSLALLSQVRPHLELTFENILSHINTVYVLRTKKGVMQVDSSEEYSYLRLKVSIFFRILELPKIICWF